MTLGRRVRALGLALTLVLATDTVVVLQRRVGLRLHPFADKVKVTKVATRAPVAWAARWPVATHAPHLSSHLWYSLADIDRPALVNGVFYAAGRDGTLRALEVRSGRVAWAFGGSGRFITNFLIATDRVVTVVKHDDASAGVTRNDLVVLDARTGEPVLTVPLEAQVFDESLAVFGDRIWLAAQDNVSFNEYLERRRSGRYGGLHPHLIAVGFDGRVGATVALADVSGDNPLQQVRLLRVGERIVASKRRLYSAHELEAFRLADGVRAWSRELVTGPLGVRAAHQWGDRIVLHRDEASVTLIDGQTGAVEDDFSLAALTGRARVDASVLGGETLYVVADDDHVVGVDLPGRRVRWTARMGYRRSALGNTYGDSRLPGVQGDTLYVGGRDASVYAIDTVHGKIRYRFVTPQSGSLHAHHPPLAFSDLVLVVDKDAVAYRPHR